MFTDVVHENPSIDTLFNDFFENVPGEYSQHALLDENFIGASFNQDQLTKELALCDDVCSPRH